MENPTSVVFDCSGTLLKINRAIKHIESETYYTNKQTVDIVDENKGSALVIAKTRTDITKIDENKPIINVFNKLGAHITYCNPPIIKNNILCDRNNVLMKHWHDTINILDELDDNYTEYGHAVISDTINGKIAYTISTGGKVFPEVPELIKELKNRNINVYVASGDSQYMIKKLCNLIGLDYSFAIPEAHQKLKRDLITKLKNKGHKVIMVGDGSNDVPAMLKSDISVASLQNGDVSQKVLDIANYKIKNIVDLLNIIDNL